MYQYLTCLIFLAVLLCVLFCIRRKQLICKVKNMKTEEKCARLDELVKPFGYCYYCKQGMFSSRLDAWQRQAGYTELYDVMAVHFQMVFDRLPVYFDYAGKTWRIEFWKGQYGINTGAEIGIYHANRILSPNEYRTAVFSCASQEELLSLSFVLVGKNGKVIQIAKCHWWLTVFLTGCFSNPSDLFMKSTIIFPNEEMCLAFHEGALRAGVPSDNLLSYGRKISILFANPPIDTMRLSTCFFRWFAQQKNRLFCHMYRYVTRPFERTEDRVLYLYYYLPFAFRKLLRLRRFDKRCHRKKRTLKR